MGRVKYKRTSPEGLRRLRNVPSLQFSRWDWIQTHGALYVSMCRTLPGKLGEDATIQLAIDGELPFAFAGDVGIYNEFLSSLAYLRTKCRVPFTRVVICGSGAVGVSFNPLKGDALVPTWAVGRGDVDVCLCVPSICDYLHLLEPLRTFPSTQLDATVGIRYQPASLRLLGELDAFHNKWASALGGLQITLCDSSHREPPWEYAIWREGA